MMKGKIALATLAFAIFGATFAPAALASSEKGQSQKNIACYWAKPFLERLEWERGYSFHDRDFDFSPSMIDDELDLIPPPPPMTTVEVWKGNKKEIYVVPSAKETTVVIFEGGKRTAK